MNSIEAFEKFLNGEMTYAKKELLEKNTRSVIITNYRKGYFDAILMVWENFQWMSAEYHEGEG